MAQYFSFLQTELKAELLLEYEIIKTSKLFGVDQLHSINHL